MTRYRAGTAEIDTRRQELRRDGVLQRVEPQVFRLIETLIENRDRVLSKEALVDAVWGGRIVSDAAISSRVSLARRALGDTGKTKSVIKTLPRRGYRFVAAVEILADRPAVPERHARDAYGPATAASGLAASGRASILIAHFTGAGDPLVSGFTRDIAYGLARLRSLFVIAPATAISLAHGGKAAHEAALILGTDYVATGRLIEDGPHVRVDLELWRVRSHRLIWSDSCTAKSDSLHAVPGSLIALIVGSLSAEIQLEEVQRALREPVATLDAWQTYHRGLWHMHRFTRADNAAAQALFGRAVVLDPSLASAYGALSYAHWMNAFAFHPERAAQEQEAAYACASQGLETDPKNPAALWSMSRVLWMRRDEDAAMRTIDQAVSLSPNFALARHSRSFVECQTGDPLRALEDSKLAQALSPFDPWRYAMFGVQAFANARLGQLELAAEAARSLVRRPNSHVQARGLAAMVLALAGADDEAKAVIDQIRQRYPGYAYADFLAAYHVEGDVRQGFDRAARRLNI